MQAIVAQRSLRSRPVFATALNPENVKALEAEGAEPTVSNDDNLAEKAEKYVTALRGEPRGKARALMLEERAPAASSSSSSSQAVPQGQVADWRSLPTLPEQAWTQPQAKQFLPTAVGCVIAIHKNSSWMIKYPREEYPKSHTVAFTPGDIESSSEALRECLRWAWRCHRKACGQECPYNLGEAL